MKKSAILIALMVFVCQILSCSREKGDIELDTIDKKFSYIMGYEAVGTISNIESVTIDEKAFIKGIRDAFDNNLPLLTQQQGLDVKALVFDKERARINQQIMKDSENNLSQQKAFLEENKTREGVTDTDSGLQYLVLKKGEGQIPSLNDIVRIYSRATLLDGSLVRQLSTSEVPEFVTVKGDLPFWEKALTIMPIGSRFRFFVPSPLAYGETGNFINGGRVGPNQLIIIDIELLEIKKSTDS